RTSQPELVGVFHAGYSGAAALNVVVSVDQLREELETLHVPKREGGLRAEITAQDRDRLVKELFAEQTHALTFPFGGRIATVRLADPTTLRFSILDDDYPLVVREGVTLVDRGANGFGTLDGIVVAVAAPTQPSADDTVAAARKDPPVQPSSIAPVAPSQTGSGGDRSGR